MAETIETILLLLGVLVVVAVAARRLNTPASILLVIAGIVLALVPDLPRIALAPELVLLGILPPLIYSAGVAMSWREFKFSLRPIALFAFGGVVFTTCGVAAAAYCSSACRLLSVSCSAPSCRRPTRWRRSPLCGGSACRAGWSSYSKAKVSPTTLRP